MEEKQKYIGGIIEEVLTKQLYKEIADKRIKEMNFLMDWKVDVNAEDINGLTPLIVAIINYPNIHVNIDLEYSNKNPKKDMIGIAETGTDTNLEIIKLLLKNGAKAEKKDYKGRDSFYYIDKLKFGKKEILNAIKGK